ncbi:hypothetical protein [Psychroflexus aestuariivivens]|uniref:hypothetical protein n=1 Tax=Psychroflexus aestuariivivens TaxID=1795040 RepID=UPI000FD76093|nr:hypothetical protein [Psychroflexus aestuariivivens]
MSKIVFENTDKSQIEKLLLKIGKVRLEKACEMKNLPMPKKLEFFKIECNCRKAKLYYKFPNSQFEKHIFLVNLHNEELPDQGWIMKLKR